MSNGLDKVFDFAEGVLNSAMPQGKIGFALLSASDLNQGKSLVWHFAPFGHKTPCGVSYEASQWRDNIPGGYQPACCKCLRAAAQFLEDNR